MSVITSVTKFSSILVTQQLGGCSSLVENNKFLKNDKTLQNFIYKHTLDDLKNVQRKKKKENVKLAQTKCQNLSVSKTNHLQ
jgi:hypothetical protein